MLRWALDSQTPRHVLPLGESGGVIGFLVPYYASTTASKPQRRPFRDPIVAQDLPRAFVYLIFPQATLDDQIATFNLYTPCATERMGPWRSSKRGLASLLTVQPASTVDLSSLQDITEPACQSAINDLPGAWCKLQIRLNGARLFAREQFLAVSCTNVGVGPGGTTTMLAHVAIVNFKGAVLFDKYVQPTMPVTDFRTATTGITAMHIQPPEAWPFQAVQQHVANLFKGKILVGHCIWNDLSVLGIPHPAIATRDVALYQPFRNALRSPQQSVGLSTLSWQLLCRRCQEGQINPVENARVALDLYRSDADEWEGSIARGNWPCALPPSTFSRCYL